MNLIKQDRNHRIATMIANTLGARWFSKKRILDLGVGDGEILNTFSKMGAAELIGIDARQGVLDRVNQKFPHIRTLLCDLDTTFPFTQGIDYFDLIISIDTLNHLKQWEKHIGDICNFSNTAVIEAEVADSMDPNYYLKLYENKEVIDFSFHGEGSILSAINLQNQISNFHGKYKRIDETKLNSQTPSYKYDWVETGMGGRNSSFRRLWVIRRDPLFIKKQQAQQKLMATREMATRSFNSIKNTALCLFGEFSTEDMTKLQDICLYFDLFIHCFDQGKVEEITQKLNPISLISTELEETNPVKRELFGMNQANQLKNIREQETQKIYGQVIYAKFNGNLSKDVHYSNEYKAKILNDQMLVSNSMLGDVLALSWQESETYLENEPGLSLIDIWRKQIAEFNLPNN